MNVFGSWQCYKPFVQILMRSWIVLGNDVLSISHCIFSVCLSISLFLSLLFTFSLFDIFFSLSHKNLFLFSFSDSRILSSSHSLFLHLSFPPSLFLSLSTSGIIDYLNNFIWLDCNLPAHCDPFLSPKVDSKASDLKYEWSIMGQFKIYLACFPRTCLGS